MKDQRLMEGAAMLGVLFLAGCDQKILVGQMNDGGTFGAGGVGGVPPPAPTAPTCDSISTAVGQMNPCGITWAIAFSPDGKLLATGTDGGPPNIHLWSLPDGEHVRDIDGFPYGTLAVAFSPDGQTLAVAGESLYTQGGADLARLYDVASGAELRSLPTTDGPYVNSIAFSGDGTMVATGGYEGPVEVWLVSDGTLLTSIAYATEVESVHFAPTGSRLIVGAFEQRATVWDVPAGTLALTLPGVAQIGADAVFSPDGRTIATTNPNNDVDVWDASGSLLQSLPGHAYRVSQIVWITPDRFVTNDWGGVINSWARTADGTFALSNSWNADIGSSALAASPDKTLLAASAYVIDPSSSRLIQGFEFLSL
jgi:WD40 repeat protein